MTLFGKPKGSAVGNGEGPASDSTSEEGATWQDSIYTRRRRVERSQPHDIPCKEHPRLRIWQMPSPCWNVLEPPRNWCCPEKCDPEEPLLKLESEVAQSSGLPTPRHDQRDMKGRSRLWYFRTLWSLGVNSTVFSLTQKAVQRQLKSPFLLQSALLRTCQQGCHAHENGPPRRPVYCKDMRRPVLLWGWMSETPLSLGKSSQIYFFQTLEVRETLTAQENPCVVVNCLCFVWFLFVGLFLLLPPETLVAKSILSQTHYNSLADLK